MNHIRTDREDVFPSEEMQRSTSPPGTIFEAMLTVVSLPIPPHTEPLNQGLPPLSLCTGQVWTPQECWRWGLEGSCDLHPPEKKAPRKCWTAKLASSDSQLQSNHLVNG